MISKKPAIEGLTTILNRGRMPKKASTSLQPFESIPGPRPLPFIGNLWRYLPIIGNYKPNTLYENAQYNKNRYGLLVREKLFKNHSILHLFDPADIETYFGQDGKYPHRRSHRALLKYRRDRPDKYVDGGLFPENGPHWYRQRNQFSKYLMLKCNVAQNIPKIDQTCLKTVKWIDDFMQGNTLATHDAFETILYRWAMATTLSVFLDTDMDRLDPKVVDELMKNLDESLEATDITEIQTEKWIKQPDKCPYYQRLVKSQEFLREFTEHHINELLCRKHPPSDGRFSYLNEWLQRADMDKRDVISFVIESLMAGLHTTSYTTAFLLYHLFSNTAVLQQVRSEIQSNLSQDEPITIDKIDKLSLLGDCLKESMRLNPVSIGFGRLTSKDNIHVRNYNIPLNTMIIAQTQTISRDESVYSEPNQFKPGRWSHYRSCPRHQRPSPYASLPFGVGPRSCIGRHLAKMQIKVLVLRLVQRFNLEFQDVISTKTTLIHTINNPCRIKISRI